MSCVRSIKRIGVHNNCCSFASLSPDGCNVLIGTEDEIVKVYQNTNFDLKEVKKFRWHSGSVNYGIFSNDGRKLVTCSNDKTVIIYSVEHTQIQSKISHHDFGVSWCTFSPDNSILCSCSWDNTAALFDPSSGLLFRELLGHKNPVTSAEFNQNNQLATSSWDKTIRVWDIQKGVSYPLTGHTDVVWSVTYSPTNPCILASVSRDKTTSLWDTRLGGRIGQFSDGQTPMNSVKFSPNGEYLVSGGSDSHLTLRLCSNLASGSITNTSGHRGKINSISFSSSSSYFLTAGNDGHVNFWSTSPGTDDVDNLSHLLNFSDMLGGCNSDFMN